LFSVTEFSKKTGDYASLSATDLKVLALTYMLEKVNNGVGHLRIEPVMSKTTVMTSRSDASSKTDHMFGFHKPKTMARTPSVADSQQDKEVVEDIASLSIEKYEKSGDVCEVSEVVDHVAAETNKVNKIGF